MIDSHIQHLSDFPPHAVCWLWDTKLILLHAVGSLVTSIAYFTIPVLVFYIYSRGKLQGLSSVYPELWILGGCFVFFCGLSHFGDFVEIWIGGPVYWLTGINSIIMAVASVAFTWHLYRKAEEIILIGKALRMFMDKE